MDFGYCLSFQYAPLYIDMIQEKPIEKKKINENERMGGGQFGTLKEFRECQLQQTLAHQIKHVVDSYAGRNIRISDYLTLRTACNIMNLARSEPYGLKGCKVILKIEEENEKLTLGSLYPEEGIISTFEVTLVLHLKKSVPAKIPFLANMIKPKVFEIADQYELRKEKLYMYKSKRNSHLMS